MLRTFGLLLSIALLAIVSVSSAWAIVPLNGERQHFLAPQSLIIQAKKMTERQKCKALNRCRQIYTHCENKLMAQHKLTDASLDEKCTKPYQKCIHSHFQGGDWFFTRWFNPSYLDCKQY
jgi:hypothetical protein